MMRLFLVLLSLGLGLPAAAQSDAEQVEQVARDALAAISAKDSTAFMALMTPGARAYSVSNGASRFRDVEVDATGLARASGQPAYLERMWDPTVLVDGDLAVVWTPYDFWIGDQFSHCGTDVFTMMRTEDGWRLATIAYNVVRDCQPSPLGLPQF
jgi:ketosteroid isomerase-like protein